MILPPQPKTRSGSKQHMREGLECKVEGGDKLTLAVLRLRPGARISLLLGRDGSGWRQAIGEAADGGKALVLLLLLSSSIGRRHGGTCALSRGDRKRHAQREGGLVSES